MQALWAVRGLVAKIAWHAACHGYTLFTGLHSNHRLCLTMPATTRGAC